MDEHLSLNDEVAANDANLKKPDFKYCNADGNKYRDKNSCWTGCTSSCWKDIDCGLYKECTQIENSGDYVCRCHKKED